MKKSTYGASHTLKLSTGQKIRVRRPSILSLLAAGGFPAAMTAQVFKLVDKTAPEPSTPEEIREWANIMDVFLPCLPVDVKIVTKDAEGNVIPTDLDEDDKGYISGTLNVRDILDLDKQALMLYSSGALLSEEELEDRKARAQAAGLAKFPDGAPRLEAGPSSEAVRAEAEPVGGVAG